MWFIWEIFNLVWEIQQFFYNGWNTVRGWIWPFNRLGWTLYALYLATGWLLEPIAGFGDWIGELNNRVINILSYSNIYSYFKSWFDKAENAWAWVRQAPAFITNIITSWWSTTLQGVQAWVMERVTILYGAINYWSQKLTELRAEWDSFTGKIPTLDWIISWWSNWPGELLSVINSWWTGALLEVQGLINTAFIVREDFWAGWQDWRDKVIEFFSDPLGWLESRFTNWFLGAE